VSSSGRADPVGRVVGAVLAGGRSSRMGADKSTIEVDGVTMLDRAAAALGDAGCVPVVSVGGAKRDNSHVADLHPGEGPLGGVVTALAHTCELGAEAVVVVACDMPSLNGSTISRLVDAHRRGGGGRVVAAEGDRVEPMCALWPVMIAAEVNEMFQAGERSVAGALDRLDPRLVPIESSVLANVNTPDDLQRLADSVIDRGHVGRASGDGRLR